MRSIITIALVAFLLGALGASVPFLVVCIVGVGSLGSMPKVIRKNKYLLTIIGMGSMLTVLWLLFSFNII